MVFCTFCGREFVRKEHLQRHILTHTNLRPFRCSVCCLSFNRKDVARRHTRIHDKHTSPNLRSLGSSSSTLMAQNCSVACANCTKAKTNCNKQVPCTRCRSKGVSCTPHETQDSAAVLLNLDSATTALPSTGGVVPDIRENTEFNRNKTPPRAWGPCSMADQATFTLADGRSNDGQATQVPDLVSGSSCPRTEHFVHLPVISSSEDAPPSINATSTQNIHRAKEGDFNWAELLLSSTNTPTRPHALLAGGASAQHDPTIFINDDLLSFVHISDSATGQHSSGVAPIANGAQDDSFPFDPCMTGNFLDIFGDNIGLSADLRTHHIVNSELGTPNMQNSPLGHRSPSQGSSDGRESALIRSGDNVACLGDNFAESSSWSQSFVGWRDEHFLAEEKFTNVALNETTRDRTLGIAQSFFTLALDSLSLSANPGLRLLLKLRKHSSSKILLLPPNPILHQYLENFLTSFEPFFPLVSKGTLDPNQLVHGNQEELAVISLLLMIAYGSVRDPATKARRLSAGLLEICILALVKLVDKDSALPRNPLTIHCAVQCLYQTAFSGDHWLMDATIGQLYMYIMMARHTGIFQGPRDHWQHDPRNLEGSWNAWIKHEYTSRLSYACLMLDQEIAIFYDSNLTLAIHELERPLPEADDLWLASDAATWARLKGNTQELRFRTTEFLQQAPPSLRELFKSLLDHTIDDWQDRLGILQMRLLLYPIHILVCQLCETFLCFPRGLLTTSSFPRHPCQTSSTLQLEEIMLLLRTWQNIFNRLPTRNTREGAFKNLTLLLYHLLSLKICSSFTNIERYSLDNTELITRQESHITESCVRAPQEAIFHCGQVIRITRETESPLRPLWWPAAIYRVAMILWYISKNQGSLINCSGQPDIHIDVLPPTDGAWQLFLKYDIGTPRLASTKGSYIALQDTKQVLNKCTELLRTDPPITSYAETLALKLGNLASQCACD
ncbi:uncharacterized protein APUU_80994S [Aspergillus puulaauensis]|uniref:Uncharacterized protein n=1 Tax=Aspergillus puulaauensis TaxID=1220207 RepID=A0A7R7XZS0_9EURO|nr:uncharacterized protein APUU_80994S [Aspergillus puulaauensis]BCS30691.1 hypothetical protein APUU_80994S [Aspergillus puulaauensis]